VKHAWAADLAANGVFGGVGADWRNYADRLIEQDQDRKETA
jgi:hypothetical protein